MKTIVLATANKHKLKEYKEILNEYNIISLEEIGYMEDIVEDGTTFSENALIKARTISNYLKSINKSYIVVGEDSGLCVDSLNGEPGIYSARYSGVHGDNESNRAKLQRKLLNKDRNAYFMCAIALVYPDGNEKIFNGKCLGEITKEEFGKKDFGYDCIFYSYELNKTFGEATEEEKNSISHRSKAINEMLKYLNEN